MSFDIFSILLAVPLIHLSTVWRTSTAEPTRGGIIWTAEKDVTRFRPIFARPGKLMFDENNLITDYYTGEPSISASRRSALTPASDPSQECSTPLFA